MKRTFFYRSLFLLSLSIITLTCSSDDDANQNNNAQEISQIIDDMESGTWIVTSYIDSGTNETSDFNGYNFEFLNDGTVIATNGTTNYNGIWSVTDDSNSADDSDNDDDIDFNLSFPVPDSNNFDDLSDDWDIISHSATMISLRDISGGDGSIDTLIFERN